MMEQNFRSYSFDSEQKDQTHGTYCITVNTLGFINNSQQFEYYYFLSRFYLIFSFPCKLILNKKNLLNLLNINGVLINFVEDEVLITYAFVMC